MQCSLYGLICLITLSWEGVGAEVPFWVGQQLLSAKGRLQGRTLNWKLGSSLHYGIAVEAMDDDFFLESYLDQCASQVERSGCWGGFLRGLGAVPSLP